MAGEKVNIYGLVKSVYGPKGFNLTDSEFADDMKDSGNRKRLYKNLSKEAEGFDMSYAEYEAALGYGDNKPAAELRGTRTFGPAAEQRGTGAAKPAAEPQGTGTEPWKKMVVNDNDNENENSAGTGSGFREVRKAKGADSETSGGAAGYGGNKPASETGGHSGSGAGISKDEIEAREANAGWPSAQSGNDGLRSAEENFERLKEVVGIWNEKGAKFEHGDELLRLYGMFYDKGGKSKIEGRKNAHESLVRLTGRLRDERVNRLLGGEIFKTNMTEIEGDELGMMRERVDEMKENERKKMEAELDAEIKRLGERRSTEVNPVTGRVTYDAAEGAYATERNNLRVEGMRKIDEEIAAKYGKLDERLNKEIYRRERQYAEWNLKEGRKKREEIMGVINDNDNDNENNETRRGNEAGTVTLSENAKMNMNHAAAFDKDARDYLGQQNRWEAEGNNWMQSVGQHLGAGVTAFLDKDNVPVYGTVAQFKRLAAVYEVAKKLNDDGEGNLTSDEKALLDSYNNYIMVTSGSVGNNRSSAVRTGEMMGESANFMAQMAMFQGVVKALGKGATLGAEKVAQRLLNYAARTGSNRLAKGVLKATEKGMRGFAKGVGKMYGEYDVQVGGKNIVMSEFKNPLADFAAKEAGATLQTIVTPQMYLDLAEKRAQVMASDGRDLTRSEVIESMYNSWNEISSEASFNRLNNWLLNKAYKGVSPLMPKFVKDAIDTRKYLRTGMNVFHGMPQEFMEEEIGAGRSWLVGKLAGWDETVKQSEDFFTKEGQLDMLASFALPTMVGGGMQMGLAVRSKHQYERSRAALLNGMRGMGMSDADIDGMVGFMEQSKDLETFESRANTLHAAIMTKKMEGGMDFEKAAEETDRLMGDYVRGFMTYNENLNTTMEQWEKMSDEEKEKARVLYGGLADDIAHSRYEAGVMAEVERKYNLGAGGLANVFEQRKAGYALTEEEEKAANEYAHRMLIEAEVREQLQPKMEEIDQRTNKNGMLVSGVVDGKRCYVKENNGSTSVVMFEDGSTKQVKSDKISDISEQDATQMKRDMEQEMFDIMPKMDEFKPGRMVRMKNGKVGVVLQQSDEGIVVGRETSGKTAGHGGNMEQEVMTWRELDGKNALGVLPGNVYGDFVVDSVEVNPESGERTVWFREHNPAAELRGTGAAGAGAVSMNEMEFVEMLDKSGFDMSNAKYEGELTEEEQAERAAKERIEEEKAIRKEVAELGKRFGVAVNIVTDERDIPNRRVRRALSEGKKVQGWYDVNTKNVYLFLPNIESVRRAKEVVFHELVGHKGIRELVGEERYAAICQRVWRGMSEEDKARFMGYAEESLRAAGGTAVGEPAGEAAGTGAGKPAAEPQGTVARGTGAGSLTPADLENMAADEYMAWVAESVGSNFETRSETAGHGGEAKSFEERLERIWEVIKSFLDELFGGDSALTRAEVVQMIEMSAMRMESNRQQNWRAQVLSGTAADERAARQAAIEENEYIISADEADMWVEAERERLYDVTRRGANEAMDEQLARETEEEAARREAGEREDRQTGDKAERAFAASDKKRKAEEDLRREADAEMNEDMRTLEERVSDELAEAETAGAENYTQNKQKSLREGLKKARKQLEEAQEKIKGLGDIKAIRKKKAEIEAKRQKISDMESELAAWENKEREVRPSGKTVAEEEAEIKEFVGKYGAGKSQEWKETVGDAVRAGSVAALEKLRESGAVNAVEVASELLNEVGRAKGLLVNDRGTNGEKVRGKKGRGFKTMIGTRYADVKGAFAMFRDTEEALSIDQLAHELGERLVDAGMSEDGSEAVNVLQDLFQSESREWDLTHKAEKRVISEAKDIMWEEENGFNTASETGGNGGSGEDVRFSMIGKNGAKSLDEFQKDIDDARWRLRAGLLPEYYKAIVNFNFEEEKERRIKGLEVAKKMQRQKKNAKEIKLATGWELGRDGEWRYEIGDVSVSEKGRKAIETFLEKSKSNERYMLTLKTRDFADAPEFFAAYQYLFDDGEVCLYNDKESDLLGYYRNGTVVYLNIGNILKGRSEEKGNKVDNLDLLYIDRTLNHELQHYIQGVEGFAKGGSASSRQRMILNDLLENKRFDANEMKRFVKDYREASAHLINIEESQMMFRNPKRFLKSMRSLGYSGTKEELIEIGQHIAENDYIIAFIDADNMLYRAVGFRKRLSDYGISEDERYGFRRENEETKERMAREGYKADELIRLYKDVVKEMRKRIKEGAMIEKIGEFDILDKALKTELDYDIYRRLAGEVEARAVAKRVGLDRFVNRRTLLREDEDIPRDRQIAYDGSSELMSEGGVRFAIGGDETAGGTSGHGGDRPAAELRGTGADSLTLAEEREDVIEGMSDAKLRIEEVKKREPVYRDRGHAGESVVQFMQRWQAWREEMVAAAKESEAADRAYREMYGESVPEIPKFQTGMTLGEYMQLYTQYANNIDGAKLVADWNKKMRPIRRIWSQVERQLYEKNVSLDNWMKKLKKVAKENGLDFEIDEETNVLEAIRQVSSRVEPRVRGFVMNEMKAVAKAIAAISVDAENEYGNWRIAETRNFWTVQRQKSLWKIGDWEYGIRWRNVDSETTPEAERRDGKELTPLELIGAYLQALDAVEAEQHPEWDIPDRGMWGFLNQLYIGEGENKTPLTAEGLIEMFEENVGEEKCLALQDAMFNATQFTMNELLRGGLISQEEYDETMRIDENGNAERRHYVPERGWAKEEYMDETVFTDAMRSASGRTSISANPIIYTFLLAQSAVNTAERNLMRQKMYNMAMKYKTLGQATGAYRVAKMYFWRAADGMEAQWTETPPSKEAIEHDEKIKEEIKEKRRERMKVMAEWRKVEYALRMKDVSEIDIEKKDEEFTKSQKLAEAVDAIDAEIKRLQEGLWINPIVHDMNKQKAGYDSEGGRLVKMRVNGVEYSVVLDDTEAARAINGMFYREYSDTLHKAASTLYSAIPIDKLTKFLSALKTQYSFTFAASNFVRDVQFAAIMNSVENGEKFAGKAFVNTIDPRNIGVIKAYLRGDLDKYSEKGSNDEERAKREARAKMMRDFVEGGGITGYSFMQDSKKMRDMFGKILKTEEKKERGMREFWAEWTASPLSKSSEYLELASQVSELMTRFGQYVTAIESGMSKFDAISQAKHITTNFNIQGNIAGYLGPLFMFTNATLQGGYRIILAGCKSKKARRKLGLMCALYAVGGFLQAFFAPDDPDEERFVPDWLRKTSLMVGGFAVPLPHFFRTMWYAGTCVAQAVKGTKTIPEALLDGLTNMIEDNLPTPMNVLSCFEISKAANTQGEFEIGFNKDMMMRNIMPSLIQPWFDVAYNINFMGSPIYKEAFGGKDADERANKTWLYFRNTDKWLIDGTRWLQKETGGDPDNKKDVRGLDYNPGKIQYIVKSYTGGALVDMWKAMQDVIGCSKALYYWDGSYVPKAEDWVLVNRFYKPYEPDRMQTAYYWDVKNCNDAFIGFYKGLSKEEKEEWKKSKAYKVYEESNGKVGAMNEKIKRGESLSNEEVKELMEWSRRWNLVD